MTNKSEAYNITPEHFARARADIAHRRALLDAELAGVEADEETAAAIAQRYSEDAARYEPAIAAELPEMRAEPILTYHTVAADAVAKKARKPTPSRAVPSGRPWTPDEEAAVILGKPKDDESLAVRLNRKVDSIAKRRRLLRARSEHDPVAQSDRALASEAGGSEFESRQDRQNEIDKAQAARAGIMEAAHDPSHPDHEKAKRLAGMTPDIVAGPTEPPKIVPVVEAPPEAAGEPVEPLQSKRSLAIAAGEPVEPLMHPAWTNAPAPSRSETPGNFEPVIASASILAREAELEALDRFEAEHGVTTCPEPGSAEWAALPMLTRAKMGRKWGRSEN
jgi:hypothetical protein